MEIEKIGKSLEIQGQTSIKELKEKEIRVAAYIRVSTISLEESFSSQAKHYYNKITENENWRLVNIYGDEAITGTSIKNRKQFMKMIYDALNGEIDLILTKSISRFARNTVDSLNYIRMLKEKNVSVYFEEENINSRRYEWRITINNFIISCTARSNKYCITY